MDTPFAFTVAEACVLARVGRTAFMKPSIPVNCAPSSVVAVRSYSSATCMLGWSNFRQLR